MAGVYDGKRKHKKEESQWCPGAPRNTEGRDFRTEVGPIKDMRKKIRCPVCNKRLLPTTRYSGCHDSDCVENNLHAELPPHKAK